MNTDRTAYVVAGVGIVRVTVERETKKSYILKRNEKRKEDAEIEDILGHTFYVPRVRPKSYPIFFTLKEAIDDSIDFAERTIYELAVRIERARERKVILERMLQEQEVT